MPLKSKLGEGTMSTGDHVNFHNGKAPDTGNFNITLDDSGHLEFRANDKSPKGLVRMTIYGEDANEVRFNGSVNVVHTVTIGNTGWDGALQLRTKDEEDTIFLGSSDTEAQALLGTHGRSGRVQLKNGDGDITVDMNADNGVGGEIQVSSAGKPFVTIADNQINVNVNGLPVIKLDGSSSTVTVGSITWGTINIQDGKGNNIIVLDGSTGEITCTNITCKTINGKTPVLSG
jgi:hypothetical protein